MQIYIYSLNERSDTIEKYNVFDGCKKILHDCRVLKRSFSVKEV